MSGTRPGALKPSVGDGEKSSWYHLCLFIWRGGSGRSRGTWPKSITTSQNINSRNWPPRPRTTPEPAGRGDSPPGTVGHARCSDQSLREQGAHRQMSDGESSAGLDGWTATACTENPTVFVIYSLKKRQRNTDFFHNYITIEKKYITIEKKTKKTH